MTLGGSPANALELHGIQVSFGGLRIIGGVHLAVQGGTRCALIGPNGAGKTTLFNVISGEVRPTAGRVLLFGRDVTALPPHARVRAGLSRTFQRNNLFFDLTVFENAYLAVKGMGRRLGSWRPAVSDRQAARVVLELLERGGLGERARMPAGELSYGEQRALEIVMALASRPRVLLLDEPTAGMSAAETVATVELLRGLPREVTLLIVEHDMDVVTSLADRVVVMSLGELVAQGSVDEVRSNPRVAEVYLGSGEEVAV